MRGSRFTQEQSVCVQQEHEAGAATAALCRQHGISEQIFYQWKQKYGGLGRRSDAAESARRRERATEAARG